MPLDWTGVLILLVSGIAAGALNVIAGGGSFITLPVLIFLGLPATAANGTNRIAILVQNLGAVWGFNRHRVLDWSSAVWAALPAGVGSLIGVAIALSIGDQTFQRVLAFVMVALTIWTLFRGSNAASGGPSNPGEISKWALAGGFFLVGIYGGFVQAGVGFLILAVTSLAGLDLVRGNAIKVLSILVFTAISLTLFAWYGKVDWILGLVLAAGNFFGGLLGVRLTVTKGHKWVQAVVTVTVVLFALKLWFSG